MKWIATAIAALLVMVLVTWAVAATRDTPRPPTYTITHEPTYAELAVGDSLRIEVYYHSNPQDTTVFSRMALDYDSTVVRCVAIENGRDVPSGAYAQPFVNWGPVCAEPYATTQKVYEKGSLNWKRQQVFLSADNGTAGSCEPPYTDWVAQQVYLGQFWEPYCSAPTGEMGTTCEQWSGHGITYTFIAVGPGATRIEYPEYRLRLNYVDMQPWVCRPGYVAEYTSDPGGLRDCIEFLYLPNTTTVVVSDAPTDVLPVESRSWGMVKELFRDTLR